MIRGRSKGIWSKWHKLRDEAFTIISSNWDSNILHIQVQDDRYDFLDNLLDNDARSQILYSRQIIISLCSVLSHKKIFDVNAISTAFTKDEILFNKSLSNLRYLFLGGLTDMSNNDMRYLLAVAVENLQYFWPTKLGEGRSMLSFSNNRGIFFTPFEVMEPLIQRNISNRKGIKKIADPFAGLGFFIGLAAERIVESKKGRKLMVFCCEKNLFIHSLSIGLLGPWMKSINCEPEFVHCDSILDFKKTGLESIDIILTNPPYSRLKFHANEVKQKESDFGNHTEIEIKRFIDQKTIEIKKYKEEVKSLKYLEPAVFGELDLYRLGLVISVLSLGKNGAMGAIIPSTLAADYNSKSLRNWILSKGRVQFQYVDEKVKLFPTVNQPTILLDLDQSIDSEVKYLGNARNKNDLEQSEVEYTMSEKKLVEVFGENPAWPMCTQNQIALRDKMILNGIRFDESSWIVKRGECDISKYSKIITKENDTELIRGDNIERFRVRASTLGEKAATVDLEAYLSTLKKGRDEKLALINGPRIVCRQVSYISKKRRLSWALIQPGEMVSNSCNFIFNQSVDDENNSHLFAMLGILNSKSLDEIFRITSSNNHVSSEEINSLPIPNMTDAEVKELAAITRSLIEHYRNCDFGDSAEPDASIEDKLDKYVEKLFKLH